MSQESLPSQFSHEVCGYGNRVQYCLNAAAEPDGDAKIITEILDELLYDKNDATSEFYRFNITSRELSIDRVIRYFHIDLSGWVWPLLETELRLSHKVDRISESRSYDIQAAWRVHQIGNSSKPYVVRYHMTICGDEPVYSTIEQHNIQPDLKSRDWLVATMTGYDFQSLHEQLAVVCAYDVADQKDKAYGQNKDARIILQQIVGRGS